jgi:hypothetical protein
METGLKLLMRDGALAMSFRPHLDPVEYADLTRLVNECTTRTELREAVESAAKRLGHQVECKDLGL